MDHETTQRLQAVSSSAKDVAALSNSGFKSATQIAETPVSVLSSKLSAQGVSETQTIAIHNAATIIRSRNQQALVNLFHNNKITGIHAVDASLALPASKVIANVAKTSTQNVRITTTPANIDGPASIPPASIPLASIPLASIPPASIPPVSIPVQADLGIGQHLETDGSQAQINLDTLFGDSMTVSCDDCNSVNSPAAYFVDLLRFLKNCSIAGEKSVLDKLFERRPDLKLLELSCANTNVALPYIDLVNEILEAYVVGSLDTVPVFNVSDDDKSQDLIMQPRYVNSIAYAVLKKSLFTPLPYDKDVDGVRSFSQILGTSRLDVIDSFSSPTYIPIGTNAADAAAAKEAAVVAESLSLLQEEYYAITGSSFWPPVGPIQDSRQYYMYWGFDDEAGLQSATTGLQKVKQVFLPLTRLNYNQLLELLKTRFINPLLYEMSATELGFYKATAPSLGASLAQLPTAAKDFAARAKDITIPSSFQSRYFSGQTTAQISSFVTGWLEKFGAKAAKLVGLQIPSAAELDTDAISIMLCDGTALGATDWQRIWTLIKLWRASGDWSLSDVSEALVLAGSLNPDTGMPSPATLAEYLSIRNTTKLMSADVSKILPLWTTFDYTGPLSIYADTLLQPKFTQVAGDFSVFQPSQTGVVFGSTPSPTQLWTQLAAALDLSQAQLNSLKSILGKASDSITLASLSQICQLNALAGLLDIDPLMLPAFVAIFSDPLTDPTKTYNVLDKWTSLQKSGFTVEQLSYIATGKDYSTVGIGPTWTSAAAVTQTLLQQYSSIQSSFPDVTSLDNTTNDMVLQTLSKFFGSATSGQLLLFLNGTMVLTNVVLNPALTLTNENQKALAGLSAKLNYVLLGDGSASLRATGILTEAEKAMAMSVSTSQAWNDAIDGIDIQAATFIQQILGPVLTGADPAQVAVLKSGDFPANDSVPGSQVSKQLALLKIYQPFMRKYLWKSAVAAVVGDLFDGVDQTTISYITNDILIIGNKTVSDSFFDLAASPVSLSTPAKVYLIPPTSDIYKFSTSTSTGATPVFSVGGLQVLTDGIRLVQGVPYEFAVTGAHLSQAMWQTSRSGPTAVPQACFLSEDIVSAILQSLILMKRLAFVLENLSLSQDELSYITTASTTKIDLSNLTLAAVETCRNYVDLRDSLQKSFPTGRSLLDLFKWATNTNRTGSLSAQISEVTGWPESLVSSLLVSRFGNVDSDVSLAQSFTDVTILMEMASQIQTASMLGFGGDPSNIEQLCKWAQPLPLGSSDDEGDVGLLPSLKIHALATLGADAVGHVNNGLRSRSRDALISWILHQQTSKDIGIFDADTLFEWALIDVQMDTGLDTSRIKQAISTVQLFVQRCLMNLEHENDIPTTAISTERWTWMQSYPLWQANREVFLYPENWLDPSLRDDKTEFFTQFETSIASTDLGSNSIEDAIKAYVYSLAEIANPCPIALHYEEDGIIHCFSTSWHAPYVYFHRSWNTVVGIWTPWQQMDIDVTVYDTAPDGKPLDVAGSFVIPYSLEGRLYVFLPRFTIKTKDLAFTKDGSVGINSTTKYNDLAGTAVDSSRPGKYWEIKVGFVEYQNGRWTPAQTSGLVISDDFPQDYADTNAQGVTYYHLPPACDNPDGVPPDIGTYRFWPSEGPDGSIWLDITRSHPCGRRDSGQNPDHRYPIAHLEFMSGTFSTYVTRAQQGSGPLQNTNGYEVEGWEIAFQMSSNLTTWSTRGMSYDVVTLQDYVPSPMMGDTGWPGNYIISMEAIPDGIVVGTASSLYKLQDNLNLITHDKMARKINRVPLYSFAPYSFVQAVASSQGIQGLYTLIAARLPIQVQIPSPAPSPGIPLPLDMFQWDFGGQGSAMNFHELRSPSAIYLAELGLHIPMMLADRLLATQQLDLALQYCQLVFNPLADGTDASRCWLWPPFKLLSTTDIKTSILAGLQPSSGSEAGMNPAILDWRENPFMPHVIARDRPQAYMKWVVMKYIEILVAKGDYYFRQNTLESVPLAIQCYVQASHIYGPRSQSIPPMGTVEVETYDSLNAKLDDFSDALVDMELQFPYSVPATAMSTQSVPTSGGIAVGSIYSQATTKYFCIAANPQIKTVGDTIDDRLFKIRHSMDINGVLRSLALWEPPLDPGMLVRAAASGLNLSSVVDDLDSPMPNYRFYYLLQKALELCNELKQLGSLFLTTKEKADGEKLSALRAKQESVINAVVKDLKTLQLSEATKSLEALQESRRGPAVRMAFYLQLAGEDVSKVPGPTSNYEEIDAGIQPVTKDDLRMGPSEQVEMDNYTDASKWSHKASIVDQTASYLLILPELWEDFMPFGAGVTTKFDSKNVAAALQAAASSLRMKSDVSNSKAASAGRKAQMLRQLQERRLQANIAGRELKAIDAQIDAQQVRMQVATQEIAVQDKQVEHSTQIEIYLRTKYTNVELYSYLGNSIKSLNYQTYQLAYDIAKRAEKAFHFEQGSDSSSFIQFGYWDSAHDGLLAAEELYMGLKRLEMAYISNRPHDFEVTKHVSLRAVSPMGLLQLRSTGSVEFSLPETLFDMDFPGHYARRIKCVSISIPCVAGPYTSINCTLRLLSHKYRTVATAVSKTDYPESQKASDARFATTVIPISSIATSSGQNDSGVFNLNFNDERYVPFEGAGAISTWRLELPAEFRQFDYDSISDVLLHLKYTSRDGGSSLRDFATGSITTFLGNVADFGPLVALFDLRNDFSSEWYRFANTAIAPADGGRSMQLSQLSDRLPFFARGGKIIPTKVSLLTSSNLGSTLTLGLVTDQKTPVSFGSPVLSNGMYSYDLSLASGTTFGSWQLMVTGQVALPIERMWILVAYYI